MLSEILLFIFKNKTGDNATWIVNSEKKSKDYCRKA